MSEFQTLVLRALMLILRDLGKALYREDMLHSPNSAEKLADEIQNVVGNAK